MLLSRHPQTGPGLGRAPEQAYLARSEGQKTVSYLLVAYLLSLYLLRNVRRSAVRSPGR